MELETERLKLRELVMDDWSEILGYQSDPRYLEFYPWTERTPEAVQDFVDVLVDLQTEDPRTKFQLAITLKPTKRLIGNCGVRMASATAPEADIGYELSPDYWGNGY